MKVAWVQWGAVAAAAVLALLTDPSKPPTPRPE
jgi:hypothetical protein